MTDRRAHIAGLAVVGLFLVGCSGDDGDAPPERNKPGLVSTNAKAPGPCEAIDGSLIDELIGSARGVVQKSIDPSQAVSSARCAWDSGNLKDKKRKQGTVEADVTVELKHAQGASPYSGAKAAYNGLIGGKACQSISAAGSDACWYRGPSPSFSVVVRKNYVTVWITSTATGSSATTDKHIAATVKQIAENVAGNVA